VDGGYFYARVLAATETSAKIKLTKVLPFSGKIPVSMAFTALGSEGELEAQRPTSCEIVGVAALEKESQNSPYFTVTPAMLDAEILTLEVALANARDMRLGVRFKLKA
jgi:hypothetical protein